MDRKLEAILGRGALASSRGFRERKEVLADLYFFTKFYQTDLVSWLSFPLNTTELFLKRAGEAADHVANEGRDETDPGQLHAAF